ncbi:MAG TPA: NUDIX hydrolase [Candidatus Limnocylindrales bacterium]
MEGGTRQIVLGQRHRERDGATWTLPKGTPDAGETTEQTALREVTEETGLEVAILETIGDVEYWFMQAGTRIHKVVHYFLMEPTGGALDRHDHEFDEVRWVELAEAEGLMSHESERRVVADAAAAIERQFPLGAAPSGMSAARST